jgi:hypothetical protein
MLDIRAIIQSIGRGIDRINTEDITPEELVKTLEVIGGLSKAAAEQIRKDLAERSFNQEVF